MTHVQIRMFTGVHRMDVTIRRVCITGRSVPDVSNYFAMTALTIVGSMENGIAANVWGK
jgi:hypothetical protein